MVGHSATPERMHAWAKYWLARGWHLEPCRIVLSPNNLGELKKRPIGLREGWQRGACTTVGEFEQRCAAIDATGYLIACGPSGIVAVDMDGAEGVESMRQLALPSTFTVDTPHGLHAIYAADPAKPIGNSVKRIAPGIDMRGIGGGLFGVGSWVVDASGQVAGEWRGRPNSLEPQTIPQSLVSAAGVLRPERLKAGADEPPAPRRPASSPEHVHRAWQNATRYFEIMQAEAANPTGRWNNALYGFVRWAGRTMATVGYESAEMAIDEARRVVLSAIEQDPNMYDPDERDRQTIFGQGVMVGLRQGPWELNEQPETIDRWGQTSAPFDGADPGQGDGKPGAGPASVTSAAQTGNTLQDQHTARVAAMLDTFLTEDLIDQQPDPVPLIEGWIDVGGFALIYGQPGTMKSFLALDMLAHIATGQAWQGCAARKAGVLYIAGEGGGGMKKRLGAWRECHGGRHGVVVRKEAFDLFGGQDVAVLIDACRSMNLEVICLDTLNASAVGMKENDAGEMGRALASIKALQRAGLTVLVVHHTPRDGSNPRGSSALEGASDHGIRVDRRSKTTISVVNARQKDRENDAVVNLMARFMPQAGSLALSLVPAEQEAFAQLSDTELLDAVLLEFIRDADQPPTKNDIMRAVLGRGNRTQRADSLEALRNRDLIEQADWASSDRRASGVPRYGVTQSGINYLIKLRTVEAPKPGFFEDQSESRNMIAQHDRHEINDFDVSAGQTAQHDQRNSRAHMRTHTREQMAVPPPPPPQVGGGWRNAGFVS